MIAHVAESGEESGRVVLHFSSAQPNALALAAAIRVARAFGSEVEMLFVEDEQLYDCAAYTFVREVSLTGRQRRVVSAADIGRDLHFAARGARRQIEALARRAEVPLRTRVVRDEPLRALSVACAERGPWNVVALAEPFTGNGALLHQLLLEVAGTTGLVVVGPKAQRVEGFPVAVVEDIQRLPDMLRTAERLAALDGTQVVLLLVASEVERLHSMDGEARLVLEGREDVRIEIAAATHGAAVVIAEALRRLRGGFVICQLGGLLVPDEGDLRPLAGGLECPLFVVR